MEQDLLQHILDVSRHMAETRDLALLLDRVMDEAIRLVGAERGYMVLVQPDDALSGVPGDVLDFRVQRGPDGEALEDAEDQVSRSILSQVVDTGQPLVLRDATQDPRFGTAESVVILRLRSIMCVPLVSRGDTIGAIYVENRSIRGRFRQDDAIPLVLFANQAAVAIENARLFQNQQKTRDELEMRVKERTAELSEANALLEREIVGRKQVEKALRESEELFSLFMDYLPAAAFIKDKDGKVLYLNKYLSDLFGLADWPGRTTQDLFPRSIAELMIADDREALSQGYKMVIEVIPDADGIEHMYQTHKFAIEKGGEPSLLGGIGVDITKLIRAEEALRDSEERFRALSEAAFEAIFLTEKGHCLGQNQAAENMFGYKLPEAVGRPSTDWIAPQHRELAKHNILSEYEEPYEVLALRKDGTTFPAEIQGKMIRYRGRDVRVTALRDITERVRAEESIRQLYEQTRRDAEAKATLLREVNHRVKNNLTSIIGLIQTEQRYAAEKDSDAVKAAMERLVGRINGLAQVHDILSQSEWSAVPLSELASHIMSAARDTVPLDRLVSLEVTPSPVRISPRQASNLALVINELVTNTLKHVSSGNSVTSIVLGIVMEDDNTVLLEYRDDGPGYPEDVLRLERHGVGLYLIQSLVSHALRGSLALANDGGGVTTIRFQVEEKNRTS